MGKWYLASDNNKRAIFFDQNQKKWHVCDGQKLYYRGNDAAYKGDTLLPFPELTPRRAGIMIPAYQERGHAKHAKQEKSNHPKDPPNALVAGPLNLIRNPYLPVA